MSDWQEAQMNQAQPGQLQPPTSETDLTTDDLLFMIGEAAAQGKGKDKIIKYQGRIIQSLQMELAKAQSLVAGKEALLAEIETLKKSLQSEIEKHKKSAEGKDVYIKKLEDDCHVIALERDNLKKLPEKPEIKRPKK
jgi:hypothetical protein